MQTVDWVDQLPYFKAPLHPLVHDLSQGVVQVVQFEIVESLSLRQLFQLKRQSPGRLKHIMSYFTTK